MSAGLFWFAANSCLGNQNTFKRVKIDIYYVIVIVEKKNLENMKCFNLYGLAWLLYQENTWVEKSYSHILQWSNSKKNITIWKFIILSWDKLPLEDSWVSLNYPSSSRILSLLRHCYDQVTCLPKAEKHKKKGWAIKLCQQITQSSIPQNLRCISSYN